MRITVIFDNLGPYHLARLRVAAQVCELSVVEVAASSAEYAWKRTEDGRQRTEDRGRRAEGDVADFKLVTLLEAGTSRKVSQSELRQKMASALASAWPDVVFIPGWSSRAAFAALDWCGRNKIPVVAMSESTEWDEPRRPWKEFVKRQLVGLCAGALVGGTPHRDYMMKLGMPSDGIFSGYDAVDNDYFSGKAAVMRAQCAVQSKVDLPKNYFLASARFIEKKNLPRLIKAYARYRKLRRESGIWDLVLLGDGVLRGEIEARSSEFGVRSSVHLPGFVQYPELPNYYAGAGAFIHASITEQWGLVVNEAMASGLPVLVSNRCGCAMDLVQPGVNGFTFDPYDTEELAQLMLRISDFRFLVSDFGTASARIIADWGTQRFAAGLKQAAEFVVGHGAVKPTWCGKVLLKLLLHKP